MARVAAIGLSGQMLGVTLLDRNDRPLRPALLWNDGRAAAECAILEERVPGFAEIVGCRAMPGFSAPKILWLARHEPSALERARRILLTKDYIRLQLTGDAVSDQADASATLLMDAARGEWAPAIVDACGVRPEQLPRIVESGAVSGIMRAELAVRWRLSPGTPVAGSAGDNMCGAVGSGVVSRGDAFISLGTSGVVFVADDRFVPALGGGMHTHRHAVGGLFAQHGVVLSAASALDWAASFTGVSDVPRFVAMIEAMDLRPDEVPVFTPYLGGERTPHDDPLATATLSNLSFASTPAHLGRAVLDGVALALGDCHDALLGNAAPIERVALIGGGARSRLWAEIIATVIDRPLRLPPEAALGPALGAARLARRSVGGPLLASDSTLAREIVPRPDWRDAYARRRELFRRQYQALGRGA